MFSTIGVGETKHMDGEKQIKSNGLHLCLKSDKENMLSSSSLLEGDEETHVAYMVRKTMMKDEKLSIINIKWLLKDRSKGIRNL